VGTCRTENVSTVPLIGAEADQDHVEDLEGRHVIRTSQYPRRDEVALELLDDGVSADHDEGEDEVADIEAIRALDEGDDGRHHRGEDGPEGGDDVEETAHHPDDESTGQADSEHDQTREDPH